MEFPIKNLDLKKYVDKFKSERNPVYYDLFGVVNHFGNLQGGHYTAFCKNALKDQWYEFNDSSVT